ncbi:hypothetical protein HUK65_17370 [Rhodobacteraceae bacterium 2376]|uniref:Uncharacterized protein n=1 Tax=Rhabdonatronobacter sediminivivens TaxID=2743469 RepID=A0A7Z0I2J0_9RHOB|nr:hypothetical protein [Rhabdonatronobacter sediminivivens]NYS26748.1 hypothetical protein [Rhabdonatronobacter sediminivivens]
MSDLRQIGCEGKGPCRQPRTALDLLARIQRHKARIGERAVGGLSTTIPDQLDLFDTLSLPKPA